MASGTIPRWEKYEVGDIFITTRSGNPNALLGYGTWEQIKDKFLLSAGDSYTAGSTGGSQTHQHIQTIGWDGDTIYFGKGASLWGGEVMTADRAGSSASSAGVGPTRLDYTSWSSNIPPYFAVYMWLRTA